MLKICLTGGPCGGKSTALSILTQVLSTRGYKVLVCSETPTELIEGGAIPGSPEISMIKFQYYNLPLQLFKESLLDQISECYNKDKLVIIYDRGLCDPIAYVEKEEFEVILAKHGLTIQEAYSHYDGVFHLVTAAKGAEKYYQWNDPSKEDCGNNAARSESPELARKIDDDTLAAWIGHPHLRVFDNSTDFETKMKKVVDEILSMLGIPESFEIERKFLIKKPSLQDIESLGYVSKVEIVQTYLIREDPSIERRVRQRGSREDGYTFFYTEKEKKGHATRVEREKKINKEEYISLLSQADVNLHQIRKTRYCFVHNNQYFEMDLYPFSDEYAILEIELNKVDSEVDLPDVVIIKEVTDDDNYSNASLARTASFAV